MRNGVEEPLGVPYPDAPVETSQTYFSTPSTVTVIFWLILLIEIWTLAASAAPAPHINAARMMAANHLKPDIVPSGLPRTLQPPPYLFYPTGSTRPWGVGWEGHTAPIC